MFPHSTMLEPMFWIIMGVLYTAFVIGVRYWFQDLNLKMTWWKWLLSAFWFFILNISIAGAFTLMGEGEKIAGLRFLGFFGIISIILGVGLWRLLVRSKNSTSNKAD